MSTIHPTALVASPRVGEGTRIWAWVNVLPGATIGHADPAMRSDRIDIPVGPTSTRLRYALCPFNPFVGSDEQNVCQGK